MCVRVLTLSRSDPATLEDLHHGAVELNCARMRKKVRTCRILDAFGDALVDII